MTMEDKKTKLLKVKICVVGITYTYDIGLFFSVITKDGVYFEEGYNLSMWPCIKLSINDEVRDLKKRIIKIDFSRLSRELTASLKAISFIQLSLLLKSLSWSIT